MGVTALAGLALAAGGGVPTGGPHARNAARAAKFLLDSVEADGLLIDRTGSRSAETAMYGHGFAVLFLCEIAGELPEADFDPAETRATVARAVRRVVASQNRTGGWRYLPTTAEADVSVTVCQIAALRSARDAGFDVPPATVAAAAAYVRRCRNPADGGFFYRPEQPDRSRFARTAAAVSSLQTAGAAVDGADAAAVAGEIDAGLRFVLDTRPAGVRGDRLYQAYGRFYATRAAWRAGGETWDRWFPPLRDDLLRTAARDPNGLFWRDREVGDEYVTAMNLLSLRVPQRLLPIFAR